MAKDTVVNNGTQQIKASLTDLSKQEAANGKESAATGKTLAKNTEQISTNINSLGDGLTSEFQQIDKEIETRTNNLVNEINALGGFFQDMLSDIANLNNTVLELKKNSDGEMELANREADDEDKSSDPNVDTGGFQDITDKGGLKAVKTAAAVNAAGYSLLFNALQANADQITGSLSELGKIQVASQAKITAAESAKKNKSEPKEDSGGKDSKAFTNFLKEASGPLQSVATATLAITASLAVLSLLPITPGVGLTVMAVMATTMIGAFFLLKQLANLYEEHRSIMDKDKKGEPGNLHAMIDSFAGMLLKFSLSFAILIGTVMIAQNNAVTVLTAFGVTIGLIFAAVQSSKALAKQTKSEIDADDGIFKLLDHISNMILKLTVSVLLLSLMPLDMLAKGFMFAIGCLALAGGMVIGLSRLMKSTGMKPKEIEAFSELLKSVTNLIMITGILVIVLGILPMSILIQGMIATTIVLGLIEVMILGLTKIFGGMGNIQPAKVNALTNFLKALTITIAVVAVLVVILGIMPIPVLIQGMLAVTLIFGLIILATKLISKVKIQAQAFIALAMITVFAAALAIAGALIALIFAIIPGGPVAVMLSALALVAITMAFIVIGYASNLLVPLGVPAMAALIPFKLLGIAFTLIIAVALAGAAVILAAIIPPEMAKNAAVVAISVMLIAVAFVAIGASTLVLAALAFPLMFATWLAKKAISSVIGLVAYMAFSLNLLGELEFNTEGLSKIGDFSKALVQFLIAVVAMSPVLTLAAYLLMPLLIPLTIVAYAVGKFTATLLGVNLAFILLANMPESGDVSGKLENFKANVKNLQDVAIQLNSFTGASLGARLAIMSTMGTVAQLNLMMRLPAFVGGGTAGIDKLADALGRLAQTAPGLKMVAESMKEVAAAASELGNMNVNTRQSIEVLTKGGGSADNLKEDVKNAKSAKRDKPDKESKEQTEVLNQILGSLNSMNGILQQVVAGQNKQTDTMNRNSGSGRTASMGTRA